MQRILEITHDGKLSSFTVAKITRSKLYGSKRRIPIDGQGQECSRAALTRDGRFILANGGTDVLYLDKQGDVAERSQLQAIDADGEVIAPGESTSNAMIDVGQVVEAAEVLDCAITHAYALEPVFISVELETSLSQGIIYSLPQQSMSGNNRAAFLFGNNEGYFLLLGEQAGFEFIGLEETDLSPPDIENDYDDGDNIDFGML